MGGTALVVASAEGPLRLLRFDDRAPLWRFGAHPPARTQTVRGGIVDTAPFHWEGDLPTLGALVFEVFERRMSGAPIGNAGVTALAPWLDALDAPPRPRVDAAARERGRGIFESPEAACAGCHAGPSHTNGATVDVGTGGLFQVPVLTGIAFRAPYMHDGCAPTLRDRVTGDPACTGGDQHGHTSHLDPGDVDDLLAYLTSL